MYFVLTFLAAFVAPPVASAHEVYVLPEEVVNQAISAPAFSQWNIILLNTDQFFGWGFIGALAVLLVFLISISSSLENFFDPILAKLPPYAPLISRVTVGLALLAGSYYGALFGPELPLIETFGSATDAVRVALAIIGVMIILGFYTRTAALAMLIIFGIEVVMQKTYMLTYLNYAGEMLLLLILGAHVLAVHNHESDLLHAPERLLQIKENLKPYAFLILRIAFGTSLIYASLYAKVIHNQLALNVAYTYPDIVHFFGFEPHFLVLGAAIIEILIGAFFILGIEIRFTSLFLLFWLSLSLWYFGEAVWPHLILIGIPIAFMFYGYDQYSLEGRLFKRDGREPVL